MKKQTTAQVTEQVAPISPHEFNSYYKLPVLNAVGLTSRAGVWDVENEGNPFGKLNNKTTRAQVSDK